MGNSRRQSPHCLHLLRLTKLLLQSSLVRNVLRNHFEVLYLIFLVPNYPAAQADGNWLVILPFPIDLDTGASSMELAGLDSRDAVGRILVDISFRVKRKQFLFGTLAQHRNQCGIDVQQIPLRICSKDSMSSILEEITIPFL